MKSLPKPLRGFTLIELLVVIGVLTVLLAIVLIAINPARQFSQANNTQRRSDVNAILNAVHQYGADNKGDISALGIPTAPTVAAVIGSDTGQVDLCSINGGDLLVPTYIADMPLDPDDSASSTQATGSETCTDLGATEIYDTAYEIQEISTGRIFVSAPEAELSETIQVTR